MNILVDMHVFDDKHQGTRTYLKGLYLELISIAKNWHFFLAANNIENLKNEFGDYHNVTYIPLKRHNKFYRLLIELPLIIKKYEIDYSHFQYITPLFKKGKYIVTTHDILFEQNEFKKFFPLKYRIINGLLFKYSAKRADILLTVSEYSKQKISKLYNIKSKHIYVTPNAVEDTFNLLDASKNLNSLEKSNEKIVLYVSRVEPRKNHLILIKAFIELKLHKQGYKLVFIGSNDLPDIELIKYLENNKELLKNYVVWKQNVSFKVVKQYYANCALFVFPSLAEGFGIPILEAMMFNKKMIVSNSTAMKNFNLPKELTFNPYDKEDLKMKIRNILSSNDDYQKEYDMILSKYRWENSAELLFKIINSHHV